MNKQNSRFQALCKNNLEMGTLKKQLRSKGLKGFIDMTIHFVDFMGHVF